MLLHLDRYECLTALESDCVNAMCCRNMRGNLFLSPSHHDVVSLLVKLYSITSKGTKGRTETQKMMD